MTPINLFILFGAIICLVHGFVQLFCKQVFYRDERTKWLKGEPSKWSEASENMSNFRGILAILTGVFLMIFIIKALSQ